MSYERPDDDDMNKEQILRRLRELQREKCHEGQLVSDYMQGIIDAVFTVTAETLAKSKSSA